MTKHAEVPRVTLAVVGAHLSGQPLNHELVLRGATLQAAKRTAPCYRLFALDTMPPKPGLLRATAGGIGIEVEVWSLGTAGFGAFVAGVEAPLCIGQIELSDGSWVHGFLCEEHATRKAREITQFGSWRSYLLSGVSPSDSGGPVTHD